MKTELRPHKVLENKNEEGLHALCFTTGEYAGIVFSYNTVSFDDKDPEQLLLSYEYDVHESPEDKKGYDLKAFETEFGDFLIQLLYYGLEAQHLGYISEKESDRTDNTFESVEQRTVLPEGSTISKD